MKQFAQKLTTYFSAGSLGGLLNSLAVWIFGVLGITTALGVQIAPALTPPWLYPRLVWGGIWGILFFLPILKNNTFLRGLVFSLGPTIVQLFIVFPVKAQKGTLGLALGALTPVFVLIFNAVWGLVAAYWVEYVERA
mgnify:CR=1 FL=1